MSRSHRLSPPAALITLAACLIVVGCASGGTDVSTPVPAAPPPAKKAFEPPSFDSKVYENTEVGFSVHYPADFVEDDPQGGLFTVASPQQVPRLDIAVLPTTGGGSLEDFGEQVAAVYAQLGGGEAKIESANEVTLQDGVTGAYEFIVDWSFQGFPIKSLALYAAKGTQTVQISVTWADAFGDRASQNVDEIAYSLYFD